MKIEKKEMIIILSHLLITLIIIGVYTASLFLKNNADETLRNILTIVIGYWFGSMHLPPKKQNTRREDEKK